MAVPVYFSKNNIAVFCNYIPPLKPLYNMQNHTNVHKALRKCSASAFEIGSGWGNAINPCAESFWAANKNFWSG